MTRKGSYYRHLENGKTVRVFVPKTGINRGLETDVPKHKKHRNPKRYARDHRGRFV